MRSPSWLRRTEWFGSLTARDAGVAFRCRRKREYGGKPTKRERAVAIKRLMDKLDVALSDIEAARSNSAQY